MRLEQIMAWSPIAALRPGKAPGKTDEDSRKPRAPREKRGFAEGDIEAAEGADRRVDGHAPSEHHTVDIKV